MVFDRIQDSYALRRHITTVTRLLMRPNMPYRGNESVLVTGSNFSHEMIRVESVLEQLLH